MATKLTMQYFRAVGVAAIAYLILRSLTWALFAFANIAPRERILARRGTLYLGVKK